MNFYEFITLSIYFKGNISVTIKGSDGSTIASLSLSSDYTKKEVVELPQNTVDLSLTVSWSGDGYLYNYVFDKKEL